MIRYAYNSQLQPPAPFALVTLRHPLTGAEVRDVPAQVDTAADRTLLPLPIVQALGLPAIGSIPVGGVGGTVATMTLYPVLIGVHTLLPLPSRLWPTQMNPGCCSAATRSTPIAFSSMDHSLVWR